MPERVQLRRTKGWRIPPNTVKVDRSGNGYWGNRFAVIAQAGPLFEVVDIDGSEGEKPLGLHRDRLSAVTHAIALHRAWIESDEPRALWFREDLRRELRGKNLACWCPLDQPCHADVLLELANR